MEGITDDISRQLNSIGVNLSNLESLSRIIQTCLEYEDNLKNWDIETIFVILQLKITETKKDFSTIIEALEI